MVEFGGEEDSPGDEMRLGGWSLGWQALALKVDWLEQCGDAPRPLLWELVGKQEMDRRHRESETARPCSLVPLCPGVLVFRQQEEL